MTTTRTSDAQGEERVSTSIKPQVSPATNAETEAAARIRRLAADNFDDRAELLDRIVREVVARVPILPTITDEQAADARRTVQYTLCTIFDLTFVGAPQAVLAERVREVATEWARADLPLERTILAHEITVEILLDEASRRLRKDDGYDATMSLLARRLMKFLQIVTAATAAAYRQVTGANGGGERKHSLQTYLERLVDGVTDRVLERRAVAFGIDIHFRWAGVTARGTVGPVLVDISRALRQVDTDALVGLFDDRVVLLSATAPDRAPVPIGRAAIDPAAGPGAIAAAITRAGRAADVGGRLGFGLVDDADVAPLGTLLRLPRDEQDRFVHTRLGAITGHPRAEELLDTLAAFYTHNMVRRPTAAALFVHRHTLDYRLSRIADLTGADLEDAVGRFQNEIALFLLGRFPIRKAGSRIRPT